MRITTVLLALAASPAAAQIDTVRVPRDSARTLEAVAVSAIRTSGDAPISARVVTQPEIERRAFGQDIPLLLQGTPSLTSYAETGNFWGYSYLRMRGIDQSRINLTLDGIPLNDPEDQVLYFADFPDLANSLHSIQIQRGVGTSAPGTASYGGSINFETTPVLATPRGVEVQLEGGSFGTARASAEYASGATASRVSTYARLSALRSAGFRHHSGMEGRSGFLGIAYAGPRDILKLTALAGLFADTLAYVGATPAELAQDRRSNLLRPDEVDRFGEQLAALSYTRMLTERATGTVTLYRISAGGNYDVCIDLCDQAQGTLWNFHLDFVWYGLTSMWSWASGPVRVTAGANANTYARDHYAYDRLDFSQPLYFNTGHKRDASAFSKVAVDVGRVTLFGDAQVRRAAFEYTADPSSGVTRAPIAWTFFNPKVGATVRLAAGVDAYASLGLNGREPARSDMFAGFDDLDASNDAFVGPFSRVRPEQARDAEAGVRYRANRVSLDANAFAMDFRNEILPVGRLSYIGTPLRTNVRSSRRAGIETDLQFQIGDRVAAGLSATAMRARIADFTDDETGVAYHDVAPVLTPAFTSSQQVTLDLTPTFSTTIRGVYAGRAALTNTGDSALMLPASYVGDVSARWTRGPHSAALHVTNATNSTRYASGHVSGGEARYYVLPPLSVFLVARLGL